MDTRLCVYPGSFDPVTLGHLDLIERAARLFPKVRVAVLDNPDKTNTFTVAERLSMLNQSCAHLSNVQIDSFGGLLVNYMRKSGAIIIVRGLRAVTDFEAEFQMAQLNRQMSETVETLFLMSSPDYAYISSSAVKQIASYGGDITPFVPACILPEILKHFP
ncbi:MAG: pantetheine-phosphate adenylyltransferase [Bacillota bacterium]